MALVLIHKEQERIKNYETPERAVLTFVYQNQA